MNTYFEIENEINLLKESHQDAGNVLHEQFYKASIAEWSVYELSDYIKSDEDVITDFNLDGFLVATRIRNIQDAIINFFGEE
jgi:hypothetical protein